MPPVYAACHSNEIDENILEVLLADPSVNVNEDYFGWTPCHLAIRRENWRLLEFLLECPRIDPNIKSKNGETPLIFACLNGLCNEKEIQILLQNPRLDVNIHSGTPALTLICKEDKFCEEILKLLLRKPLTNEGMKDSTG
eukprot:CAMPEP_0116997718 /NCGR_PEP_ID=MMETSP0472-20121206/1051_1 /TAXON_ID=693140 ORGANISM="Tiarina fusus, Strain LIS" /NCGR_SAMPLE_ID=MMETSP0472 /ASSEMBLY_ACC=CAM_ASM_000603 /LENGTH=139 /DNA_ID=CAMNT_0004696673 /DNA_START=1403 /DNA_END=1818 /DNA_ORIENTATION=+